MEKITRNFIDDYNKSKANFVKKVRDDVIYLAPDEPIIDGKQGASH